MEFYDALDRLNDRGKRAIVVIAGNHDNPDRLCAASPIALRNGIVMLGYPASQAGIHNTPGNDVNIVDSGKGWVELSVSGCEHNAVILTLPYPSESRLEEILSEDADEAALQTAYSGKIGNLLAKLSEKFRDDTVNLGVSHMFLLGGKSSESERTLQVGGALTVDPAVLPEKAHFMAFGHLHRPQRIKGAPCPAYYSGSPLAYSFSEADYNKCVFIIDALPGKPAEINEYILDCGKPLCRWKAQGLEQALQWCGEGRDSNAWIDLEIRTDRVLTQEEQKKLRELNPGIINIRPLIVNDTEAENVFENRENKKIDQLFKDYYRCRTGTDIPDELMNLFIDIVNNEDSGITKDAARPVSDDSSSGGEAV
jgi:exonuclease SbcD